MLREPFISHIKKYILSLQQTIETPNKKNKMKKTILAWMLSLVVCCSVMAQDADMMTKAQEKFKNMTSLSAPVTQTRHNTMLAADAVSKGMFYFKKPSNVCLTFDGGKDLLLMKGDELVMVQDGKPRSMKAKGNTQLEALKTLLQNFSAGQESDVALEDLADVDVERDGNLMTMTISPRITDAKAKRKMLYTSFVVVIDTNAGELKSIRLNEKGSNYTQYDFGKFSVNVPVDDAVFVIQ